MEGMTFSGALSKEWSWIFRGVRQKNKNKVLVKSDWIFLFYENGDEFSFLLYSIGFALRSHFA